MNDHVNPVCKSSQMCLHTHDQPDAEVTVTSVTSNGYQFFLFTFAVSATMKQTILLSRFTGCY